MFNKLLSDFRQLRAPVRSLVFLFWTYSFTGALIGIFTQVFLYQRFIDITLNVYATIILFIGIMIGFVLAGYAASLLRINVKYGFACSFLVTGLSIILLLYSASTTAAFWAMCINGIGQGLFWLTIHTFELSETKNAERDYYSSLLSAGEQVFFVGGPALATLLIWLSESVLSLGTFTLLFIFAPLCYCASFFHLNTIRDYYPQPISWADLAYFLTEKRNVVSQLYLAGNSLGTIIKTVVPPLAAVVILGGALEVGIFNTVFAVFSAATLILIAQYRTVHNRLIIFGVATALAVVVTASFGYIFSLVMLFIYSASMGILQPLMRVSTHVIDLETMESIGRSGSDFYATMLLRDFSLFFWRMIGSVLFLSIFGLYQSEKEFFAIGFSFMAAAMVLTFVGAYVLLRLKPGA